MIDRYFFESKVHPSAVHALHIGTGVLLTLQALYILPDIHLLYGMEGLVDHGLLPGAASGLSIVNFIAVFYDTLGIPPHILLYLFFAIYLLLLLLLAGRRLPWWGILLLMGLHHAWFLGVPAFSYGVDYLGASALFYCLCTCRTHVAWHSASLRLLQLHLCLIYFFGGLAKLMGSTWWNGEAIWKAINQPYHLMQAPDFVAHLGQVPLLWILAGAGVALLELFYALLIWQKSIRRYYLGGIIAMHLLIAVGLGLFHFSAIMILLNIVAFHLPYRNPNLQPHYSLTTNRAYGWQHVRKQHESTKRGDSKKGGITY